MAATDEVGWWRRIFALDLRSLALARVMAGLVLVGDLIVRLQHVRVFYSEEGVYPRQALLDSYISLPLPSIHFANDTVAYQVVLLLLHIVVSLAVLVGYRTRQATVLCWLLLVSLHLRNALVLNGGDVLLSSALFWAMFLPWGQRWSWDARGKAPEGPEQLHFSAATVGLVIQVSSVYLFAALHKMFHPFWMTEGTAVLYALSIEPHATQWAVNLHAYPGLLKALTPMVVFGELLAGLALLTPWAAVRLLTVIACMAMHWGFGAFLELGIFRWSPWIGLLALLPTLLYRDPKPAQLDDRLSATPKTFLLLALCALTWTVNLQSLGKGQLKLLPAALQNLVPSLGSSQYWGVFVGDGLKDDGWNAIEVQTRSGQHYDMWLGGRPFSKEKPPLLISGTYPDDRWRKWMMNLPFLLHNPELRKAFPAWWLGEWNRQHPEDPAVKVTVWQVHEPTLPDGKTGGVYWQALAEATP